jgi:hypothetical protein
MWKCDKHENQENGTKFSTHFISTKKMVSLMRMRRNMRRIVCFSQDKYYSNTISPDKMDKPKHQVITTKAGQQGHSGKNIDDNGFTLVQRTHKSHQPSSLDQLKKQHNISKHRLPTPMVSFHNSYIAYYNLRVPLLETKDDASPWDEVLKAFKAMMTELWGSDPTIKIFISNTKARSNYTRFLDSPRSL